MTMLKAKEDGDVNLYLCLCTVYCLCLCIDFLCLAGEMKVDKVKQTRILDFVRFRQRETGEAA